MDFSIGKPWLPSGNDCYIAIENGPVEIVSFLWKMVIFHSYVSLPEGKLVNTTPVSLWFMIDILTISYYGL